MQKYALVVVGLLWTAVVSSQRPDFRNNEQSNRSQTAGQDDSLVTKKLVYSYRDLSDLHKIYRDFDTSLTTVHLVEPIYRAPFLSGSLGSEYSIQYHPLFESGDAIGTWTGNDPTEDLTRHEMSHRIVDVNRALGRIQYAKGYSIDNSNFDLGFYRKFNRQILLNIQYNRVVDDSESGLQPNSLSHLDIKWMQSNQRASRRSYLKFSKADYEETHSRGVVDGTTEMAGIVYNRQYVEIGNQQYLADSLISESTARLDSRFIWKNDDFSFRDASLSPSERDYFAYTTLEDTLTAINALQTYRFDNAISKKLGSWQVRGEIGLAYHERRLSGGTSGFFNVLPSFSASTSFGREWVWHNSIRSSFFAGNGDFILKSRLQRVDGLLGNLDLSVVYRQNQASLLEQAYNINSTVAWSNEFAKLKELQAVARYDIRKSGIELEMRLGLLMDYVVFDEGARPFQLDESVSTLAVYGQKDWNFWSIETTHRLFYQNLSTSRILRPNFGYSGHFSAPIPILRKKINLMVGLGLNYLADFGVPAFNPVIGRFYNDGSQARSGHVLQINPTLNFKIDRFFGFIKINNATSRLSTGSKFTTADFPIYDFRIVAGFRWDLLD